MKKYETPEFEVVKYTAEDVLTDSSGVDNYKTTLGEMQ